MEHGYKKTKSVTLPVSAGLQLRFRLCKYVDFFAEARAGFYGDNFNNIAFGRPIDINLTVNGGFAVTFGGRDYQAYNPCDYLGYIDNLNNQVNDLRGSLATTAAALAAAEAQLPCPEVVEQEVVVETAPLMATVRFSLNSSKITDTEMVNVFNIAEWMKANPEQNVAIVGYADKDTGTSEYNMGLSKCRAQSVYDALTGKYQRRPSYNPGRRLRRSALQRKQLEPHRNLQRTIRLSIGHQSPSSDSLATSRGSFLCHEPKEALRRYKRTLTKFQLWQKRNQNSKAHRPSAISS